MSVAWDAQVPTPRSRWWCRVGASRVRRAEEHRLQYSPASPCCAGVAASCRQSEWGPMQEPSRQPEPEKEPERSSCQSSEAPGRQRLQTRTARRRHPAVVRRLPEAEEAEPADLRPSAGEGGSGSRTGRARDTSRDNAHRARDRAQASRPPRAPPSRGRRSRV